MVAAGAINEEDRRIFEYFVVAGLPEESEELSPGAQECGYKNTAAQAPVTDVCVIFPNLGEQVPEGFTCIETTPSGYPADLNHGSLRTPSCYLCYRRGYHKPPLVDIGVLYEGKGERVMVDSQILQTTPFGRPANVNNASQGIYLTYRRAPENTPPNLLAVTDVCVILMNKGESAPHTFCRITKNLNKGMVGSDVFICYKKSQANANRIAYKPAILDRFPKTDDFDFSLPANVPIFCLPMGAVIECWPAKCQIPSKVYSTFVLTDEKGSKFYGAAVTFYEQYSNQLTNEQMERLGLSPDSQLKIGSCSDNSSTNDPAEQMTFQTNRAICVVSRYPFFTAFKRFLFYLHRMSVTGSYPLPIERYISHLMYEVPFPTPRRPRVLVQLGHETISFDSHDDSPLPLSGAAYIDFLKNLGVENCIFLLELAILEHKILIHSLRPWLLTSVAEAIISVIFPFHWQCPYIPQCPLDLAGVLHAPLPFIAGVDSRYFELYEDPPKDVTCIDLDTATVSQSEVRKSVKLSMLPRRPAKVLKQTLENLYRRVHQEDWSVTTMRSSTEFMPVDVDYKMQRRRRILELEIQEAFLRFMVAILKGYRNYLKPIKSAPKAGSTDTGALFDMDGFMRSRDRSAHDFYKRLQDTQCFIRFIEERSLLSDKNAYLAFFDDCVEKVDPASDRPELKLLEYESSLNSNHTVFIAPPEPMNINEKDMFVYRGFPKSLDSEKFQLDKLEAPIGKLMPRSSADRDAPSGVTPVVRRTKGEAKSAQKMARKQSVSPLRWAKCLLSYSYSLWFIHLPAFIKHSESKTKALKTAMSILDRMQNARLPVLDEVCYRTLMQLCGQYGRPLMTVKVFMGMRQQGIQPNAITYGFYNRAVLEANWPSTGVMNAEKSWTKLRHVVRAIAVLKKAQKEGKRQRRTLSQFSQESGADYTVSQSSLLSSHSQGTSVKQSATDTGSVGTSGTGGNEGVVEGSADKGTPQDQGYQSQTTEDSVSLERATTEGSISQSQPSLMSSAERSSASGTVACLTDSHLEVFDELRQRGRNIVFPKRTCINEGNLKGYDSPAGLLMIGGSSLTSTEESERRKLKRRSLQQMHSHQQPSIGNLPTPQAEQNPIHETLGSDAHILTQFQEIQDRIEQENEGMKLCEIPEDMPCVFEERLETPSPDRAGSVSPSKSLRTPVMSDDPLGATTSYFPDDDETSLLKTPRSPEQMGIPESPSRAELLLQKKPFEDDDLFRKDSSASETSGSGFPSFGRASMRGWLNKFGLQNTPVSRFKRSQTSDEDMNTSRDSSLLTSPSGTETGQGYGIPLSPSLSQLMTQASVLRNRVGDVMHKQQPNIAKLKSGVSSVLQGSIGSIRNFRGNLDQLGSPLKGSWSSLSLDTSGIASGEEYLQVSRGVDSDSLKDEVGGMWLKSSLNTDEYVDYPKNDPAFQLSSGETGSIITFDYFGASGAKELASSMLYPSGLLEVILCSCNRCPKCTVLCYDEEVLAGWTADESNLNTRCQFCQKLFVPVLTVRIKRYKSKKETHEIAEGDCVEGTFPDTLTQSWYVGGTKSKSVLSVLKKDAFDGLSVGKLGNSVESLNSLPGTPSVQRGGSDSTPVIGGNRLRTGNESIQNPVNRQLFQPGTVMESSTEDRIEDSERDASPCDQVKSVATDQDNRRVPGEVIVDSVPTSLGGADKEAVLMKESNFSVPFLSPLVLRKEIENVLGIDENMLDTPRFMETHPILFWNLLFFFQRLCVPSHFIKWISERRFFGEDGEDGVPKVVVRCVCDLPEMHEDECSKPLYLTSARNESHESSPLVAALVLEQRMFSRPIVDQILDSITVPNLYKPIQLLINEHRKRAPLKQVSHSLPKHCSIYRDILFLALTSFGREVRRDDFDREYAAAFAKLHPKIGILLPPADHPPNAAVRFCRKVFMPLDVY